MKRPQKKGRLYDLLKATPHGTWHIRAVQGKTLLHYALTFIGNGRALRLLLAGGLDPNASDAVGQTPIYLAVGDNLILEVDLLCAAGAELNFSDINRKRLGGVFLQRHADAACRLIANGLRVWPQDTCAAPLFRAFQLRILQCRSVTAALLRVKQVARLVRWDKFLLREIALAVWSTRGMQ